LQGDKSEKETKKERADVHLLATDAQVIFWNSVFFNTTSATSFATLFQHRFYSIVFCNISSTLPLQHCFLQEHFNIASIAPSSTTLFLLLNSDEVYIFWWGRGR
jgi:hypothetical protein